MELSRRQLLKTSLAAGAVGFTSVLPTAIEAALAIDGDPGTTFYDAEHIVLLMQENRSFDHMFGCMRGVRGFGDPRARILPDGNRVWVQKSAAGNAHAPFRLDFHQTKITWQGGLPHDWPDQSAARNDGKYDQWIPHKSEMCLGYFTREDMPFYYALADAFTICDHYFCSSLTGTTPNRLFFWTGNVRPTPAGDSVAVVRNSMAESRDNVFVDWPTFPELLEANGVSWKIYQNELWTPRLESEIDDWLGNYGDNALEYVRRHHVELSSYFRTHGDRRQQPSLSPAEVQRRYGQLSDRSKQLVDRAFTTNGELAGYLNLESVTYTDARGQQHSVRVPQEDIFHQFRKDVDSGQLPTVSWLVAPQRFSDHTSSPYYGTWYVSEALDILTRNPEVWKKTVFILNYDENDGYFDHVPPFVVPPPRRSDRGRVSQGIDTASDFEGIAQRPIGLGYRVPMIVASPWSKGGFVNSQVFDHTSTLMFLEKFLSVKQGRAIRCANISTWRRAVCGDLTSVFRPYGGESFPLPDFLQRDQVIAEIQAVRSKPNQLVPEPLTTEEIEAINRRHAFEADASPRLPRQERGTRPACALPYRLHADCQLLRESKKVQIRLEAETNDLSAGAPFSMYALAPYSGEVGRTWSFALEAGAVLLDELQLGEFDGEVYHLCIDGPNGFQRIARGALDDPPIEVSWRADLDLDTSQANGDLLLEVTNAGPSDCLLRITDNAYGAQPQTLTLGGGEQQFLRIPLTSSSGWYDLSVTAADNTHFLRRACGHIETGHTSLTDPFMGGEGNGDAAL